MKPEDQSQEKVARSSPHTYEIGANWQAYHIFYHTNRDKLLRELIAPLVEALTNRGWMREFFFVRYALGGSHIRLRIRPNPGWASEIRRFVLRQTNDFLKAFPSLQPEKEADIRRVNAMLLANDSHETDDCVWPDNAVIETPFKPEIERYGGLELLPPSLRMFRFTSLRALEYVRTLPSLGPTRSFSRAIRYMLRLSFCLSHNTADCVQLWETDWASPLMIKEYATRRKMIADLFDQEAATELPEWSKARESFLAQLKCAEPSLRLRILRSHVHMFANRLGLNNAEETMLYFFFQRRAEEAGIPSVSYHRASGFGGRRES